jgi:DNA-binding SARP family transcriptional activator
VVLDFRILGPLEVLSDSRPVALAGNRQRAVLAYLLLHAGELVSTDRLIDAIWGERPPRTAATSLQNAIGQLRKVLGPDVVATRAPGYALQVDPDRIDARRFERLVTEARGLEPEERTRRLRAALDLWRGDALSEFAFEPFAEAEIRRLEELRLTAVEERVDADLELGRHAELVAELEPLVAANPLRERLRGQLMLALYRSGRQAEALAAYHRARRALVDELGIEPSRGLQQLHASILRQEAGLEPAGSATPVGDHYGEVVRAMLAGRLVPVLGAGVHTGPDGDDDGDNEPRAGPFLPDGTDVAAYLAESFECPPGRSRDMARVSQYIALMQGIGPLYDELHGLFDRDYEPGPVHRLLARVTAAFAARVPAPPLIVSTNYDQTLEHALAEAGVEFDVVSYVATGRSRGKFLHIAADGSAEVVEIPNAYAGIPVDRAVVLKIHGQVDRSPEREWESFVVSEDDYIDYLAQSELASVVPVTIAARLRRSHFLFLGYPLQEWNVRVFLHRVWGHEKAAYRSWAVQPRADRVQREFWRHRGVDVFDVPLADYLGELERRIAALPEAAVT